MRRRQIPLNALRAFESAARQRSLTKAANELGVTHAAISHQIKHLEEALGVELFVRTPRGVEMTPKGRLLLPVLSDSFDRIGDALFDIKESAPSERLSVTTTPTFASRWLIPRLNSWSQSRLRLETHVLPTLDLLPLDGKAADVAIRCGVPNWGSDLVAEKLMSVTMTPVCSRNLTQRGPKLKTPADLERHQHIHADVKLDDAGYEWRLWYKAASLAYPENSAGISFHDPGLAMHAAVSGLGIAIGYVELIEADLAAGRLVQPFPIVALHPYSYYLVYPAARAEEPAIVAFREWIFSEMMAELPEAVGA